MQMLICFQNISINACINNMSEYALHIKLNLDMENQRLLGSYLAMLQTAGIGMITGTLRKGPPFQ